MRELLEKQELPDDISPSSRVWIYQASRFLSPEEAALVKLEGQKFIKSWAAHGNQLAARFSLLHDLFVCLFVDESMAGASGCSIDTSVRFVQSLENQLGLSLMERSNVAVMIDGEMELLKLNDLSTLATKIDSGSEIMVFNNLVSSLGEMNENWILPLKESWHSRFL